MNFVDTALLKLDGNSSTTLPVKLSLRKVVMLFFYACFMLDHAYALDRDWQHQTKTELRSLSSLSNLSPSSLTSLISQSHHIGPQDSQYKAIKFAIDAWLAEGALSRQTEYARRQYVCWLLRQSLQLAFTSRSHLLARYFVTRYDDPTANPY